MTLHTQPAQSPTTSVYPGTYTVDRFDGATVTLTAVATLGPRESRHEQIIAPVSGNVAEQAAEMLGQQVRLQVEVAGEVEALTALLPAHIGQQL